MLLTHIHSDLCAARHNLARIVLKRADRAASRLSRGSARWMVLGMVCCCLVACQNAYSQATVKTLGGGPIVLGGPSNGYIDGDTLQQAQFNYPAGCALDSSGNLYVADRDNNLVRVLDLKRGQTATFGNTTRLSKPVAVAFDATNRLYVLNQSSGTILRFDEFGDQDGPVMPVGATLINPTAMVLDANTNIYVTEIGGFVRKINTITGLMTPVVSGLNQPQGIAVLNSGLLAVSEGGSHDLKFIDPASLLTVLQIGTNGPGFTTGDSHS